ncbi:ggdef family protein [Vibrio cholerae]|nr:ggdef family protein [Vibrio cholerae]
MFNSVNFVSQKTASWLKSRFFVGNAVSGKLNLERCKFW